MQISESLYAKLASAAAKDLVEKQVPLNESVDKLAAAHDMNTAQLERLCEATNNQAFTALFEQRAKQGSDDRLVEFAVAKPREILDKRVGAEKTAQLRVRPETFDAAWESRPLPSVADRFPGETTKTASDGDPFADVPTKPASPGAIQAALDHLRHEKIAEAQKLADATNAVADHFRPMYARQGFAVFQKEAMALHKEAAHEVLAYVRETLKEPSVAPPDPDRYLVRNDKTAAHQALRTAVGARQRLNAISAALRQNGQG